jgi:hypothetical protein
LRYRRKWSLDRRASSRIVRRLARPAAPQYSAATARRADLGARAACPPLERREPPARMPDGMAHKTVISAEEPEARRSLTNFPDSPPPWAATGPAPRQQTLRGRNWRALARPPPKARQRDHALLHGIDIDPASRFGECRSLSRAGGRAAVHDKAGDHGGRRHDRQCDVGELAVGRGLPRLQSSTNGTMRVRAPSTGMATCRRGENDCRWRRHMKNGREIVVRK